MERIENDPAVWEKLFPFDLRRGLAFDFADRASYFPFVEKIVVIPLELREDKVNTSTLFIVVSDFITPFEDDQIRKIYLGICQEQTSKEVLGHVVVSTEADFLKKHNDTFMRYKEVTVVWERKKRPSDDLDRLNLNCHLN